MMQRLLAFLFALVASFGVAGAQGPSASDDIVVTGQRTEEAIQNFVDQLSAEMRGADQLARWDQRICPGIAGLRAQYAQALIDRMAQRAFDVGLDVGAPGCRANILIIVTTEPDAAAQDLFENHRGALGYYDDHGQTTLGRDALRAFVVSDAPVRWWHVGRTHTQSGEAVRRTIAPDGGAPTMSRFGGASLVGRTMREDFGVAFIIVDARRMAEIDLDFSALADYLAMVTLAQVDPNADIDGLSSILTLFEQSTAPRELTEWDVAYLRGLYASDREDRAARQQGEIARTMNQDLQQE